MKGISNKANVFLLQTILIVLITLTPFTITFATEAEMHATLVRIVQQLQSIKPLISLAESQQPANPRTKVHFNRFKDSNGHWHNGLRQDIDAIQKALEEIVNKESIEPRVYQPINDDFINGQNAGKD